MVSCVVLSVRTIIAWVFHRKYSFASDVGLSMILYTIIRKEFNGRKPAQRTHRTMIRTSEMVF